MADEKRKTVNGIKIGILTVVFGLLFGSVLSPFFLFIGCFAGIAGNNNPDTGRFIFTACMVLGGLIALLLGYLVAKAIVSDEKKPVRLEPKPGEIPPHDDNVNILPDDKGK